MSERQGTWAQWQAVAVSGLLVVFILGAGAGASPYAERIAAGPVSPAQFEVPDVVTRFG